MADINFSGLASGIDTQSMITQLMYLERAPERLLQTKQKKLQSQIDLYKQIKDSLSELQKSAQSIKTSSTFKGLKTDVGDSSVLTASASSTAMEGVHTVEVTALARSQRQVSIGYASNSSLTFNTGSFTIDDGTGTVKTVNIAEGQNSLNGIVTAINESGANVTASIINDGSGTPYRLVVTGKDTKNYTVDFSGLAVPPAGGTGALAPTLLGVGDPTYQAGTPASFKVDGVTITRTSNTVTDVLPGVTFSLLKEGATTSVTVSNDTDDVTKKINDFVKEFNDAVTLINKQSVYDSTGKTTGALSGDATLRTVQSQLQRLVTTSVSGASGAFKTLASIGITTDSKTGNLSVDSSKLADALKSNFDGVVDLFTHNGDKTGLADNQYGLAQQFNLVLDRVTHSYAEGSTNNGLIESRIYGLNKSITDIDKQIDSMEDRMVQREAVLKQKFSAMESMISRLSSQGNSLLSAISGSIMGS
ncbi:flagellar filament capping protein FliD [Geobacter hydrogenophilus]|uniref:Flagellar hook-associated protein 2 n=1 Tax=Geobacter hydrogenophilus TaxID=40983 RepID=A0A9W6G174_9BACT|nr:flagellar filament capping protein FliD [Geobacter hydrogenophilus]MBT0894231.1 flagellar filament capping protein FliD [Geobacter hydrogenophilus]GLI38483.1 flagellar hook-associated protein 2 [Geobacter hydrogenophilus]